MNWKLPHYAQGTAAVVRHNWLLLVHGPNFTHEEESHVDPDNYPDYYTRHDQPDNRGTRHR